MPTKKPRKRSSNRLTRADMQALSALDHILEEERRLQQKYNLPLGFRVPHTTATTTHSCVHCRQDIALLIFGDNARDVVGLEAYARMMDDLIQRTNLPTYVIAPPSTPGDLDGPALLLKVHPVREEPCFTTPDEWDQLVARLSDEHCKQSLTTLALSGILSESDNANVLLEETAMAEKEPTITMDNLTLPPKMPGQWPRAYECQAVVDDVQAIITVRHYDDYHYPGAYILTERTDRANPLALGTMGRKQEQRAKALLPGLREQVEAALVAAHWVKRWKSPQGADLWLYVGEQDQPQKQVRVSNQRKTVEVKKTSSRARKPYTREVSTKVITLTCSRCQKQVTIEKYPGPIAYCEDCAPIVKKEKTRARVAQYYKSHPEARKKKIKS